MHCRWSFDKKCHPSFFQKLFFFKIMMMNQKHHWCNLCNHASAVCVSVSGCTFMSVCDGRLNTALLSISSVDSLASKILPVITCPVTASFSPVSEYIVRWLELGKHEMEVTLILIQVFNGVFYLWVALLSHFRWACELIAPGGALYSSLLQPCDASPASWSKILNCDE